MKLLLILATALALDYDKEVNNYGNIEKTAKAYQKKAGIAEKDTSREDDIFYFFSIHDYNNDHKLDGHEMALAFQGYEFYNGTEYEDTLSRAELEDMIDHALEEDDTDNDGKISWEEYLASQAYHHFSNPDS